MIGQVVLILLVVPTLEVVMESLEKNRTRYRGQSGWSTSRTAAINSSRTTEAHRVKYTTGCGTGANVCYLPGNCGTTTRTVTTTRTTTVTTTKTSSDHHYHSSSNSKTNNHYSKRSDYNHSSNYSNNYSNHKWNSNYHHHCQYNSNYYSNYYYYNHCF